jgi:protein-L-isoaspartate(D-aspartate) O-methyltransferase
VVLTRRAGREADGSTGARTEQQAHLLAELRLRVRDERVLAAMLDVPRECFVARGDLERAFENRPLQIGCGQTISQPLVVARMCELLELSPEDRALDVGTGSGYHAAVLARLCREVWSIEVHAELSAQARDNLAAAGIGNVRLVVADGSHGYAPKAPYDAINVAAAARRVIPRPLVEQLAPRGRLVLPVRRRGQRLVRVRHTAGGLTTETFERVRFVPLVAAG